MRIGIYGIGGLYNFGCEAIIRGSVEFIRSIYTEPVITYYSQNYEDDLQLVHELGIEIVDIKRKKTFFRKLISKCIDVLSIPYVPFLKREFQIVTKGSDVVFSVGGDIYTIPKCLRNRKKYRYVNHLVEFGEYAIKHNTEVVIYGASIGPFGQYKKAKEYYCNHLRKIKKIICREQETIQYLRRNGIEGNVVFSPDPAFLVKDKSQNIVPQYVGLNISELSMQEVYGKTGPDLINKIVEMVCHILEQTKVPVMLIPHVLSPHTPSDNDLSFLKRIYAGLPENRKNDVKLVSPKNFLDAKKYLKHCRIVVSARMHCAINAITVGTPAIFISYSQKSVGMCRYIYSNDVWCVPINEIFDKLPEMSHKLLMCEEKIRNSLALRMQEIQADCVRCAEMYRTDGGSE